MNRRPTSTPRSAFTLIELLVVISIIALLMGLLLPAVQKIRVAGKRAQVVADITQLNTAGTSFHGEFKFYPPDAFRIPVKGNDPGVAVFQRMYPRWNPTVNASNDITPPLANAGMNLVGIQCFIYFCAGPNMTGWTIDGPYPAGVGVSNKKGPFFDYSGEALTNYTYNDAFGTTYAYFTSGTGGAYGGAAWTYTNSQGTATTVSPYQSNGKFVNSGTFQIISAGADGQRQGGGFGPGGNWTAGAGAYGGGPGTDDLANFNGGAQLGTTP